MSALDHVVVVLFENRSLDNVLGHLYGPGDGKTFEGVIGKELSNPIPDWAEHDAERKVVPYSVATDLDSPNPDSGEEWYHTNTQLFGVLDEHNRFKIGEDVTAPWNAPEPGATPTMDGFVADYISTFTGEMGRQPTYEEYSQIMTGFTPEQLPVLNGLAREFGVFDHWFSEVPSQTFMNRSFWTSATSSGLVVNTPAKKWLSEERRRDDLRTARAARQELEDLRGGADGDLVPRAHPLLAPEAPAGDACGALRRVRARRGRGNAARLLAHRAEPHPRARRLPPGVRSLTRPPHRRRRARPRRPRCWPAKPSCSASSTPIAPSTSESGSNVWNTALLIGWDEPGGTYDHVPPGPVPAPDPDAPAGEMGFTFDRSGYRVPAILVSPWVPQGSVFNDEYRHTSLIATLRKVWNLGEAFTQRDASARTFDDLFTLDEPRDPQTWATDRRPPRPGLAPRRGRPRQRAQRARQEHGTRRHRHARELGVELPARLDHDAAESSPRRPSSTSSHTSPGTTSPYSHRTLRRSPT